MAVDEPLDIEGRIRAEVDRAVAPYVGKAPPVVLLKLRELAERYFREHPQAARVIELMDLDERQLVSGEKPIGAPVAETSVRMRKV